MRATSNAPGAATQQTEYGSGALCLLSPAKINLFFRIVGRRADGFHEVATLMQAIDLGDRVTLAFAEADTLTCNDVTLPVDSRNLALRAVEVFRRKTGLTSSFQLTLEKRIPVEAGLGGGSSNAASVLWGLNQLCGKPATTDQLAEWGAEIGSDVPFFLSEGTAFCTGRGEKVRHVSPMPPQELWIIKPHVGLSTPAVYKNLDIGSLVPRDPEKALEAALSGRLDCFNDLQASAFSLEPRLGNLHKQLLDAGATSLLLAGSGSAFFCWGNGQPPKLPNTQIFQARFLNRDSDRWY